jgi:predicted PurR-regulated permease PerM
MMCHSDPRLLDITPLALWALVKRFVPRSAESNMSSLEDRTFLVLLVLVSLAFAWILWPFYGAILWALVFATVFAPAHRRLLNYMGRHPNLAALITVLAIVTIVLLPLAVTATSVAQEATNLYEKIETGEVDFGRTLAQLLQALPTWAADLLNRIGISDIGDVQARLSSGLRQASQFLASQALAIGQGTAHIVVSFFLMLYLLFFFLRDGRVLSQRLKEAVPLRSEQKRALFNKFAVVIRAMFKGTILVAALQGLLGGLIFWFLQLPAPVLWGVVMAFLSLVPAIGSALIWFPVALYLFATGAVWQGLLLVAFGGLVIGLVDNLLRPFLIGIDTKLPDYLILFSTLGGIAIFGLNGLVIGPVIAAMFVATWDIFSNRAESSNTSKPWQ